MDTTLLWDFSRVKFIFQKGAQENTEDNIYRPRAADRLRSNTAHYAELSRGMFTAFRDKATGDRERSSTTRTSLLVFFKC